MTDHSPRRIALLLAAIALAGCASSIHLSTGPRPVLGEPRDPALPRDRTLPRGVDIYLQGDPVRPYSRLARVWTQVDAREGTLEQGIDDLRLRAGAADADGVIDIVMEPQDAAVTTRRVSGTLIRYVERR